MAKIGAFSITLDLDRREPMTVTVISSEHLNSASALEAYTKRYKLVITKIKKESCVSFSKAEVAQIIKGRLFHGLLTVTQQILITL